MSALGLISRRSNHAIVLSLIFAFAADAYGLVSIPYTREAFPVQCSPGNCFYVDAVNGSDANNGTTLQTAWQQQHGIRHLSGEKMHGRRDL